MRHVIRRTLCRASFINALQLVGQASARLPFGVPVPVLHGSSAIELYTGGRWSAADLDLYTLEPRPLIAELFGLGFRRAERPRCGGRCLWHPELHWNQYLESLGFAQNFLSSCELEALHFIGIGSFGEEFREDVLFRGIQEKFRKPLA